jgi:hypothetical protein
MRIAPSEKIAEPLRQLRRACHESKRWRLRRPLCIERNTLVLSLRGPAAAAHLDS